MITNVHRWLILRLALVWLVLSLVIGGMVHYLGQARLDRHVIDMAQTETAPYAAAFTTYLQAPSEGARDRFLQTSQELIGSDNLIVVEFYRADSVQIAEVLKPGAGRIEQRLPKHDLKFTLAQGIVCEKINLDRQLFLRVFIPLYDKAGSKFGYLEGIYHAPDAIVEQNRSQTLWALVLVVLVVLVTSLILYPLIIRLNRRLLDYSHILALTNIGMLKVLGSAIAKRDSDTNIHNFRVTLYSVRIGEKLGLANPAMQGLIKGAFLHDVGKIAIPDAILLKPGKLTAEEFALMQTHVDHGGDIISSYDWLKDADEVVRCHHERFDGSGYPKGLRGEEIPLNARIFAVADVFDALTSKRPYKEPFTLAASIEIIKEGRGGHFDPQVADLFIAQSDSLFAEICNETETVLHAKLEDCIRACFR